MVRYYVHSCWYNSRVDTSPSGFKPDAITYSSDNFQKLYDLAERLIELEKAYGCHCQEAEIKRQHGGEKGKEGPRYRCKHAGQDAVTNTQKFRAMCDGEYTPPAASLRMKQDISSSNPNVGYRSLSNPSSADASSPNWKPLEGISYIYDFAHCLRDSFEGVTHSLCTTEFILPRESYEWLNRAPRIYETMQREYGRSLISETRPPGHQVPPRPPHS